jgi:hypothetical protein
MSPEFRNVPGIHPRNSSWILHDLFHHRYYENRNKVKNGKNDTTNAQRIKPFFPLKQDLIPIRALYEIAEAL